MKLPKISPNIIIKGKKTEKLKDIETYKYNIDKNILNLISKDEKLNKFKDIQMKRKISEKKENSKKIKLSNCKNEYKKVYYSFNIISDSRNTINNISLTSNNMSDRKINYDKLLFENNNKLFIVIKTFNNKIKEIIKWFKSNYINKLQSININNHKKIFCSQLYLFQKKISIFQEKLLSYFQKLIVDLNCTQKDKNINVLIPNLSNFYKDILYINEFLIKIINDEKNNTINNHEFIEQILKTKKVTRKIFKSRGNNLSLLNNKKYEYSLSTNNLCYNDDIIGKTEEELKINYLNNLAGENIINKEIKQQNIKKLLLLNEKSIENKKIRYLDNKYKNIYINNYINENKNIINKAEFHLKKSNSLSDTNIINCQSKMNEYNKSNGNKNKISIGKEYEKNINDIKIEKLTYADFFKNIYRKNHNTLSNKSDFII